MHSEADGVSNLMAARIIDGKATADRIKQELSQQVRQFAQRTGRVPGLAAVLVGENPAQPGVCAE